MFLLEMLGGTRDKIVKTICDLLYINPWFITLTFFNACDLIKEFKKHMTGFDWIHFFDHKKSFLIWYPTFINHEGEPLLTTLLLAGMTSSDTLAWFERLGEWCPFLDRFELSYQFLDRFITSQLGQGLIDEEALLLELIGKVGFLVFNIKRFRRLTTDLYYPFVC